MTTVPTLKLGAHEEKVVPITLEAGQLERGGHVVSAQLIREGKVIALNDHNFASEGVAKPIIPAKNEIVLDGDAADWANITGEKANTPLQVVIGRPDVGVADARWWQGTSDLSFDVKTTWRANDAIYLLVDVTDNRLKVAADEDARSGYRWDCLELFLDGRPLASQTSNYSPGAEQMVVVPRLTQTAAACPTVNFSRSTPTLDIEFVGKLTPDGYRLEGRIKPKPGSPLKLVAGTRFGMDVVVDDADQDQRRVQMALHGSDKNSFDTSAWGRYLLSEK